MNVWDRNEWMENRMMFLVTVPPPLPPLYWFIDKGNLNTLPISFNTLFLYECTHMVSVHAVGAVCVLLSNKPKENVNRLNKTPYSL